MFVCLPTWSRTQDEKSVEFVSHFSFLTIYTPILALPSTRDIHAHLACTHIAFSILYISLVSFVTHGTFSFHILSLPPSLSLLIFAPLFLPHPHAHTFYYTCINIHKYTHVRRMKFSDLYLCMFVFYFLAIFTYYACV